MGGEGIIIDHNSVLSQSPVPLRGFENSFYIPKSDSGQHGGVIFNKVSLELRYFLSSIKFIPLYVLLFWEAGNTWAEYSKFSLKQTLGFSSFGFGFRAMLPMIGPLGINFGFSFDPKTKNISSQIHFSSGIV